MIVVFRSLAAAATRLAASTAMLASLLVAAPALSASSEDIDYGGEWMPYEAFDVLPLTEVRSGDSVIEVAFAPGDLDIDRSRLLAWVERSARAVSMYYGSFPAKRLKLLVVPRDGDRVMGGQTFGHHGIAVRIYVGKAVTQAALDDDWVLVHEMIHTALPRLDRRHDWLHEGISVYVESIARVQAGDLTSETIWAAFVKAMPKGLPRADDRGLDNTPTWGRKYWGGAIWCLLADIEIRKRTGNAKGLEDALRGVVLAGGSYDEEWSIERVLKTADAAAGGAVLEQAYADNRDQPIAWDLGKLFADLGVVVTEGGVEFDDSRPLAAIRKSITAPPTLE